MSDDSVRDLVKRLRYHVCTGSEPPDCGDDACEAIHEAADIIETQAARIIRLQSDLDRAEGFREGVRSGEAVEGWRPIETAPKDGSKVLLWDGEAVTLGWWDPTFDYVTDEEIDDVVARAAWTDGTVVSFGYEEIAEIYPTHWRPRPAQPVLHPEEGQ